MSIIDISYDSNEEEVLITTKKKSYSVPPFSAIGRLGTGRLKGKGMDMPSIFMQLKPNATKLFWEFFRSRDIKTNIVTYPIVSLTKPELNKVSAAYKELNKFGLVKRIANKTYLVNPEAAYPIFDNIEKVREHWESV